MREAMIDAEGVVSVADNVQIPQPGPREVLIKVLVSGTNPKDWKLFVHSHHPINAGDDIAGIVESVGSGVYELQPGARVCAFHQINSAHGSWADYAIAPVHMTARVPTHVSLEEAATLPLTATTAALGLYHDLALPFPTVFGEQRPKTPLLIYGGSSAVGAFAIKFAVLSGIHPIITTAGSGTDYVKTLIKPELGDVIIDYRQGEQETIKALKDAAIALDVSTDGGIPLVFDAINVGNTSDICIAMTAPASTAVAPRFAHTLFISDSQSEILQRKGVTDRLTLSYVVFQGDLMNLGFMVMQLLQRGMETGALKPHPHEAVEGGLDALNTILQRMRDGQVSARKLVFYPSNVKPQ